MEVKLELMPHGPTKRESPTPRSIKLTELRKTVEVGRASNNPYKSGLAPSSNNAMIDSPIMSRQHARFTFVKNPPGVELQDLGSTHGTFVGEEGRKLQPHLSYRVTSGELVTFGTKVINGINEHEAKSFHVLHTAGKAEVSRPLPPSRSRRFTVPDESDESESDESVIVQEAITIEDEVVMKNTPSRGFTTPYSDEEDNYESESADDEDDALSKEEEGSSAVTTPEKATENTKIERKNSDIEKILNHGPQNQPGSSQNNPIELEPKATAFGYNAVDVIGYADDDDDDLAGPIEDKEMMELLLEHENPRSDSPVESTHYEESKAPSPPPRPLHPLSAILNEPSDLSRKEPSRFEPKVVIPDTPVEPAKEYSQLEDHSAVSSESESDESESDSGSVADNQVPEITFSSRPQASEQDAALGKITPHPLRAPSPSDAAMAKSKQTHLPAYGFYNPPPLPPTYSHWQSQYTPTYHEEWPAPPSNMDYTDMGFLAPRAYQPLHPAHDDMDDMYHDNARARVDAWAAPGTSVASNDGSTKTSDAAPIIHDRVPEPTLHDSRLHISNLINDTHKATEVPQTPYQRGTKRKAEAIDDEDEKLCRELEREFRAQHWREITGDEFSRASSPDQEFAGRCYGHGPGVRKSPPSSIRRSAGAKKSVNLRRPSNATAGAQAPPKAATESVQAVSVIKAAGPSLEISQKPLLVNEAVVKSIQGGKTGDRSPKRRRIMGGIAKFVAGATFGAVGVVAALIASAPTQVQNEAWSEFSR